MRESIAIIGGGIVGCAAARALAQVGARVAVFERRRPAAEASGAALGLLFAHVHTEGFRAELLALEQQSLELYPAWTRSVEEDAGFSVGFSRNGFVEAAFDVEHAAALAARAPAETAHGVSVRLVEPAEARALEPSLSPAVIAAAHYPDSFAVDTPRLCSAVARAAEVAGAEFHLGEAVVSVEQDGGGAAVHLARGDRRQFDAVIVAAGAWASSLLPPTVEPVRPIRGQALLLRPAVPRLRASATDGKVTAVPRGELVVVGGTTEDAGFAPMPTAGGIGFVLSRAVRLLPDLDGAHIASMWAGLRPATPSGLPRIGWAAPGIAAAVGHYRSGIILAPLTAQWLVALMRGEPLPPEAAVAAPGGTL